MAGLRLEDLTTLTTVASGDLIPVLDVSDTTDDADGTMKHISHANLHLSSTATHDHEDAAGGGNIASTAISDLAEAVSDQVGTMVAGNTETLIAVTYQDADNTLDFAVTATLSSYTNDAGFVTSSGANTALSNLATVAINTSLVSDTDITDDLGTGDIRWNNAWVATLNSGLTAADTLKLRGRDVDGAAYVDILTITSADTVTANLNAITTIGGNAILDATSTVSALTTVGTLAAGNATAVVDAATLSAAGKVELATIAETNTGTDATRAVTPDGLDGWTGSTSVTTLGTITAGVWTGGSIATTGVSIVPAALGDVLLTMTSVASQTANYITALDSSAAAKFNVSKEGWIGVNKAAPDAGIDVQLPYEGGDWARFGDNGAHLIIKREDGQNYNLITGPSSYTGLMFESGTAVSGAADGFRFNNTSALGDGKLVTFQIADTTKVYIDKAGKLMLDADDVFGTTTGLRFGGEDTGVYTSDASTMHLRSDGSNIVTINDADPAVHITNKNLGDVLLKLTSVASQTGNFISALDSSAAAMLTVTKKGWIGVNHAAPNAGIQVELPYEGGDWLLIGDTGTNIKFKRAPGEAYNLMTGPGSHYGFKFESNCGVSGGADGFRFDNTTDLGPGMTFNVGSTLSPASFASFFAVDKVGNILVGGAASPTADADKVLVLGENTAGDPTLAADTAGIFAKDVSGTAELFAIDAASNATQLSPHDENGEWQFFSQNKRTGKTVKVHMHRLMKFLAEKFEDEIGENLFEETWDGT